MDLGSLLLVFSLFVLVAWFVLRPLFERTAVAVSPEEQEQSSLLAERDRVLNALQELDFDYALGKIPPEEYPAQRASLLQYGADVLRKLEVAGKPGEEPIPLPAAEDRIEAAIAARQAARQEVTAPAPLQSAVDDPLEVAIAARRRARQEKSAGFCPQCGKPVQKSDRFCPRCGAKLA